MKAPEPLTEIIKIIYTNDQRYLPEAYFFIQKALSFGIEKTQKSHTNLKEQHLCAHELLEHTKNYALQQYGPIAYLVLKEWGINNSQDIGNIVFNLIEYKIFSKSEEDDIKDFKHWITFEEAFLTPFIPQKNPFNTKRSQKTKH